MDTLLQDLRYAARRLVKAPTFTAVVLLTLALGIGANTAVFSVVNAVLLRPLPYREPDQLVTINHFYPSLNNLEAPVSVPGFADYRDRTHVFSGVAVTAGWSPNLTGRGEPERLMGARVSGLYFPTLGVPAATGRALLPEEDQQGRNRVVLLSHALARRLYGDSRGVVGSTMQLNGESYEIVGVMPASFRDPFGRAAELWTPLALAPDQLASTARTREWLNLVARVKAGVTLDRARAEMSTLASQLKREYPDSYPEDWTLKVTTLGERTTGNIRPALLVLLGAVGFVLLIGCANVANLLLARAASRLKEVAIRTALGANRWQVVRQLLTESVLLALVGGVAGLGLAYLGVRALVALNPTNLPRVEELRIDGPVMAFTLVVSLVTGVLFGLAPALQTSRTNLRDTLNESARGATADRGGRNVRRALVVSELALALTLLVGAGLLIRSFARLQRVEPGFDPRNVLTMTLSLPQSKYASDTQQLAFFDQALPRVAAVPGVEAVGATSVLPFGGGWSTAGFQIEGLELAPDQPGPWGDTRFINPNFFRALRVPLIKGRTFTDQDGPSAPRVAVVDEEMVRRYWPKEDPIGKRIAFGGPPGEAPEWIEVVGVVGHTMHEGLDAEARVQVYLPYRQQPGGMMSLAVRTTGNPLASVNAVREAIRSVDRDQPLSEVRTMEQLVDASVGQRRLSMLLLALFSGIALLLASVGIYGVMSYTVAQRSREIGVRMALGAERRSVLGLVLRQGMALTLVGVAVGLVASFALTRLIESQLYAVQATDPATFAAVALLLVAIAALATLVPAMRATRVDPVVALRQE
jgi:putative ABC transport system permease protein